MYHLNNTMEIKYNIMIDSIIILIAVRQQEGGRIVNTLCERAHNYLINTNVTLSRER